MGPLELIFEFSMKQLQSSVVSNAVFVRTRGAPLSPDVVEKAMRKISRRHPLLRMTTILQRGPDGYEGYFEELDRDDVIDLEVFDHGDWRREFRSALFTPFASGQPNWRLKMFESVKNNDDDDSWTTPLIFSFHHSAIDGVTTVTVFSAFVRYVEQLLAGNDVSVTSLPLLSSIEHIANCSVEIPRVLRIMLKLFTSLPGPLVITVMSKLCAGATRIGEIFAEKATATRRDATNPLEPHIFSYQFTQEETREIVETVKRNDATIFGAFNSAASFALVDVMRKRGWIPRDESTLIESSYNVSMRRFMEPPVDGENVNFMVVLCDLPVRVPSANTAANFWSQAQNASNAVKKHIKSGTHFAKLRENIIAFTVVINALGDYLIRLKQRLNPLPLAHPFCVSNRGNFHLDHAAAVDSPHRVAFDGLVYTASDKNLSSKLCYHNVCTIDGRMSFCMGYNTTRCPDELGRQYGRATLENLLSACNMPTELDEKRICAITSD
ncbi:uncharacterized protein LOC141903649 isoform X2 [Tubulanus polymorphus]